MYILDNDLSIFSDDVVKKSSRSMGVKDTGPFVDVLYKEALKKQYVREVVKNGLEAGAKNIIIVPDWIYTQSSGKKIYRLKVVDDGKGMTDKELISYFNMLSSSSKKLGPGENFGIGAKTSLLPWNNKGLIIMSWTKGDPDGAMIKIVRGKDGNYGLEPWVVEDENDRPFLVETIIAPQEYKHDVIRKAGHGSVLLCWGNTGNEDTYFGPDGTIETKPYTRALNTRFFSIPDDVTIRVFEFGTTKKKEMPQTAPKGVESGGMNREIKGAMHYLNKSTVSSQGLVWPDGTIMYWWLQDPDQLKGIHAYAEDKGFIGVLHQNELYDVKTALDGRSRYHRFGISDDKVMRRLSIVVKPIEWKEGMLEGFYPNAARSRLLDAGSEHPDHRLPWNDWGQQFLDNMPQEIRDELDKAHKDNLDDKKLEEKLKPYLDRMSRELIVVGDGSEKTDPNQGGKGKGGAGTGKGSGSGKKRKRVTINKGKKAGDGKGDEEGKKERVKPDFPQVIWVSEKDKENPRELGVMENTAAEYIPDSPTGDIVRANFDFYVFQEAINHWTKVYEGTPGATAAIESAVKEVYGGLFKTKIAHIKRMRDDKWDEDQFNAAVSEEALSLAVAGIAFEDQLIKDRLYDALGAPRSLMRNVA